jgi:glyoxylase-like metal-dependent hydrolase (beta-lactamase superfamily II)
MRDVSNRHRRALRALGLAGALAAGLAAAPLAGAESDRFAGVEIETTTLRGGVSMLTGSGGNIGVLESPDGLLMVDDQYLPLAERIRSALDAIAPGGPRFVLNTHFHGDHTGGNPFFGRSGTVLAHENVRLRLEEGGEMPAAGLPVITYADRIRLHLGGETVDVVHLPSGHTDGDSIVLFREANVVHLGDHFFNGRFPFVDLGSGGSVEGMIRNIGDVLSLLDDDVVIIPGHGPLADVDDLRTYHRMLRETFGAVRDAVAAGDSDETIKARGVAEEWSDWGWAFIDEDRWLSTLIADARSGASAASAP